MKTPLLQNLSLANNFINGKQYFEWISPSLLHLKSLDLSKNSLDDEAVCNLTQMKFPKLSSLKLAKNRKLTSRYLECLSEFNTSLLTHLDLSQNLATDKSLRVIFQNKSFQNLQELTMKEVENAQNLFQYLNWKSMKKLKILDLTDTDISKSFDLIQKSKVNFSALKIWKYGWKWMQRELMDSMLKNLTSFGPELQLFEAMVDSEEARGGYINISALDFSAIPRGAYIRSKTKMTVFKPWIGNKIQLIEVLAPFSPVMFLSMGFIETMFHYSYFGNKFDESIIFMQDEIMNDVALFGKVCDYLKQRANFTNMQILRYFHPNDFQIFEKIWQGTQGAGIIKQIEFDAQMLAFTAQSKDILQSLYLPYLRKVTYQSSSTFFQDGKEFLYLYNKIKSPLIDPILISGQSAGSPELYPRLVNLLLRRNSNINMLYFIADQMPCQTLEVIFENVHLPYLIDLSLYANDISSECLANIISQHQLIKKLDLKQNFNLTTVISDVLLQYDLILQRLQLSEIQLGDEEFHKLAGLNTEFIRDLQADSTQITQNAFIWLMGNKTGPVFPKIREISVNNNYFAQQGLTALFSQKMPFLQELYFYYLSDPTILKNIVLYPTKMDFFNLQYGDIKSLEHTVDKRAFRHASFLQLDSSDFTVKDFEIFSEMQIPRLQSATISIKNINECQVLKYILEMLKNVESFQLTIKNTKTKGKILNDTCLQRHSPEKGVYFKHLHSQSVEFPDEKSYLPKFYSYVYSNYLVEKDVIDFSNHYFTDDAMRELLIKPISQQVIQLNFEGNFLSDAFIDKILQRPLQKAGNINFRQNQIKLLKVNSLIGKNFPQLRFFSLAMNELTDESIDLLVQADYPELQELSLESCDITLKGFMKLLELNAPKLRVLKLQNTLITEWDLVYIAEFVDLSNFPANLKIMTSLEILYKSSERIERLLMDKYGVLAVDIVYESHHLKEKNKAVLDLD